MSGLIDLDEVLGARAKHRYARLSASKVRQVLNLVRGEDLQVAQERLKFCERGAAEIVSKVLNSAVANATTNEHLDAETLYVAECWADEGPIIKRWRPRARGRATRIEKKTCHVTVIVAQLDDDELAAREAREASKGVRRGGADRAARVAASRQAEAEPTDEEPADDEVIEAELADDAPIEDGDTTQVEAEAVDAEEGEEPTEVEATEASDAPEASAEDASDDATEGAEAADDAVGDTPDTAATPDDDSKAPTEA